VRTFSPGKKIGLNSFVHFQTVLGEGNFGNLRTVSLGKIGLTSFVHFQTGLAEGDFGKVRSVSPGKTELK
jgi:hypothetical protein